MKLTAALLTACLTFASAHALAQNSMMKGDAMAKDSMMMKKTTTTAQGCQDHMAMAKNDSMSKDAGAMKKDETCADMMKKDGMSGPMKTK